MKIFVIFLVIFDVSEGQLLGSGRRTRCFKIPTFPQKVENVIKVCQNEVKNHLIDDLINAAYNDDPYAHVKHVVDYGSHSDHIHHGFNFPTPQHHHQLLSPDDHLHAHQQYGSHFDPHLHASHHSHNFDPHFLHNFDSPPIHHVISHVPASHHEPHQIQLPTPEPLLIEANEALERVVSLNHPRMPHENHEQITSIVEKLRMTNRTDERKLESMRRRRRSKRNIFDFFGLARTEKPKSDVNFNDVYHPTVISNEQKWVAGCLMQCVFRRNNAVDANGYPTLDGLTELYTNGNSEQAYFMHVMRAVDQCLKSAAVKYKIYKGKSPEKGETCDVAFDVFDCVSDSITDYCNG